MDGGINTVDGPMGIWTAVHQPLKVPAVLISLYYVIDESDMCSSTENNDHCLFFCSSRRFWQGVRVISLYIHSIQQMRHRIVTTCRDRCIKHWSDKTRQIIKHLAHIAHLQFKMPPHLRITTFRVHITIEFNPLERHPLTAGLSFS